MYTSRPCALGRKQSNEGLGDSLQKTSSEEVGVGAVFFFFLFLRFYNSSSPPFTILRILSCWNGVLVFVSLSCSWPPWLR